MIFEILFWILSLLIFLPNINLVFSFSKSELFPWALIFSASKSIRFSIPYLVFIFYLTISAFFTFSQNGEWLQPFRSLTAIVNATFIFYRILFCTNKEFSMIENALIIVFFVCVFIGLLQYFNLFPSFLVEFMSNLIPRFKSSLAINDIRGISSLFSEPAYYAYSFNYSAFYILYRKKIKPDNILGVLAFLFVLVFNIFFIRSATGLIFSILYIFFLFPLKQRGVFVIIFTIIGIIAITYFSQDLAKYRAISAFIQIFSKSSTYDIYVTFLDVSGFRAVSIIFSYLYGFNHFLGGGIGNWAQTSAIAYKALGIPISNLSYYFNGVFIGTRPSSITADIMLESGLLGLLLFLLAFAKYIFNKQIWSNPNLRSFIIIIVFNIFIIGTIGDPTPFIFLGLICRNLFNNILDIS